MILDLYGLCPTGCGHTLHAQNGFIVCFKRGCPRPTAVIELLRLRDVVEHRVTFDQDGFQVVHPLRERFGDLIARCPLDEHLRQLDGPPVAVGVWLAEQQPDGVWTYIAWGENS